MGEVRGAAPGAGGRRPGPRSAWVSAGPSPQEGGTACGLGAMPAAGTWTARRGRNSFVLVPAHAGVTVDVILRRPAAKFGRLFRPVYPFRLAWGEDVGPLWELPSSVEFVEDFLPRGAASAHTPCGPATLEVGARPCTGEGSPRGGRAAFTAAAVANTVTRRAFKFNLPNPASDAFPSARELSVSQYRKAHGKARRTYLWIRFKISAWSALARNPSAMRSLGNNPRRVLCTRVAVRQGLLWR